MAPTLDSEPNAENCSARSISSGPRNRRIREEAGSQAQSSSQYDTAGTHLRDGESEVPNHGVLGGRGEAAGEAELDGPERDDERAEEGGDVGLAKDGHGGGPGGDAGLPRAHPVPAARVDDQQRLPHPAVVVAAALLPGAASAPVAGATHVATSLIFLSPWRVETSQEEDTIDAKRNRRPVEKGRQARLGECRSGLSCMKLRWGPTG